MVERYCRQALLGLAVAEIFFGCRPDTESRPSLVIEPKVVALRSVPAEAIPGAEVHYEALVVSSDAYDVDESALTWQTCSLRKPMTTSGVVSAACLTNRGEGISTIGSGRDAIAKVLSDACELFGPTPPEPAQGEPALRAADPDTTGGYYQPVTLSLQTDDETEFTIGVTRLNCGIGAATQEQVGTYNQYYRSNENPTIESIRIVEGKDTQVIDVDGAGTPTVSVMKNSVLSFEVGWPDCPRHGKCGDGFCSIDETIDSCSEDCTQIVGCTGAETFMRYDTASRAIVEAREQLRVSWYASSGWFEHDRTSANIGSRPNATLNQWTAPTNAETVHVWVVIRDSRRGVGWRSFDINVE